MTVKDKVKVYLKQRPTCVLVTVILATVSILFFTNVLTAIPCEQSPLNALGRNFVHADAKHIIFNVIGLFVISRIEVKHGSKVFFLLITTLTLLMALFDVITSKMLNTKCSIGFSGVLFGLFAWELIVTRKIDWVLFTGIAMMVIVPSLADTKASLIGHSSGAIAGIILGLIMQKRDTGIDKDKDKENEMKKRKRN